MRTCATSKRQLPTGPPREGPGAPKQYDGKIDWETPRELTKRFDEVGRLPDQPEVRILTTVANSPHFGRGAVPEPLKGFEDVRYRLGGGQKLSGRKRERGSARIRKSAGMFQAHLPVGKRALGGRGGQRCFRTRVKRVLPDGGVEAMDGRLGAVEHLQEAALCVSEEVRNAVSAAPAAASIRSRSLANPLPSKWTRGEGGAHGRKEAGEHDDCARTH